MDFFYKLFPYKSLVNIDNNTLTIWWVIFTILVFLVGVFHLIQMISKIKSIQNKCEGETNRDHNAQQFCC